MAMAFTSISCPCTFAPSVSRANYAQATSEQSEAAPCVARRASGGGFVDRDGRGFTDAVLRQSSKVMTAGGCSRKSRGQLWRIDSGLRETALTEEKWGPPITLGTAQLPQDVDLNKLQNLLYQWGANLTQNANLPLPVPLKVDRIEGGVRLGYVRVIDGKVEDLVHIDVIVTPESDEQPKAMFRALRNGQMKGSVPPGEPLIMQSLLAALKMSVPLARAS